MVITLFIIALKFGFKVGTGVVCIVSNSIRQIEARDQLLLLEYEEQVMAIDDVVGDVTEVEGLPGNEDGRYCQ